jgi:hypothetical protein
MVFAKKSTPDPPPSEFELARDRYSRSQAELEKLSAEERSLRLALGLANNPTDADSDRCAEARRIAGKYYGLAVRRPDQVAARLREIQYELDDRNNEFVTERDLWEVARRRETTRIAEQLAPKHRAAVMAIARAFEALSAAIQSERDVHAELSRTAPERESALLPSMAPAIGTLAEYDSVAAAWARRYRQMGFDQ